MSESKVNLNSATDLLLLGESAKDVPAKKLVQTFLAALCQQESDISLYECLFTNIIHHFEPREFETEISCSILPELVAFLEKIQKELQTNALSYFFVENLTILVRLADVLQKLIEYLTEQTERCQLYHSLVIFPEYLLRCYTIVRQNYVTMAKETDVLEAMKTLYTVCKKILTAFLELLCPRDATGRGTYFRLMDNEEEYECLEKVCTLLASVGNEISPIDSLLASDVWKAIVKLCTEHADQCLTKNRTSWLSQIIVTLNAGVGGTFNEIRAKNEPSKQATISLKLNAFFLRVMLKLLSLLKPHATTVVFQPIVETLLQIKTCIRSSAEPVCRELATGIDQYLHIGYMAIVENSVRSEAFAKAFCHHECKTSDEIQSYYSLWMHLVEQLVANATDCNLLTTYYHRENLLTSVCSLLKRSDSMLLENVTLYKQLLIHCSALVLLGARMRNREVHKTLEETLVRMVLQDHYYTGLLGIDLWSVFVRYHSTQLLFGYFVFWKKINDQHSMFRTRPQQIFVAQLLRNLWVFLPPTQKIKLLDTYPVSNKSNDRLWATVPLSGEIDELYRNRFAETVGKRLQDGTDAMFQYRPTVDGCYETLGLLLIVKNHPNIRNCAAKEAANRFCDTLLNGDYIWNTPAAAPFFSCLPESVETIPERMLQAPHNWGPSEASVYVKCLFVKLLEKANCPDNKPLYVEPLLDDPCPLITALAFHVLWQLILKKHSGAEQFLAKSPQLRSKLSALQQSNPPLDQQIVAAGQRLSAVPHRCRRSHDPVETQSIDDLTSVINSKIDELFPDDDSEDDCFSGELDATSGHIGAKKRKMEEMEKRLDDSAAPLIAECLCELDVQGKRLQNLLQTGKLESAHKQKLQLIIATLSSVLDS